MKTLRLTLFLFIVVMTLLPGCGGGGGGGPAGTNGYKVLVLNQNVFLVGPGDSYLVQDVPNNKYFYYSAQGASPIEFDQPGVTPQGILTNNRIYWFDGNTVKVWGTSGQVATFVMPSGFVPVAFQSDGRAFCRDTTDDNKIYQVFNTFPTLLGKPRAGASLQNTQHTVPQNRPVVNTTDGSDNVVMVYDGPNWRQLGTNLIALNADESGRVFGYTVTTGAPTIFFDTFTRATYSPLAGSSSAFTLAAPGGSAVIGYSTGGPTGAIPTEWRGGVAQTIDIPALTAEYTFSHYSVEDEKVALVYTHNVSGDPLSIIFSP